MTYKDKGSYESSPPCITVYNTMRSALSFDKPIFHKRATKCRSLLREMTYRDEGSYESSPPCITVYNTIHSAPTFDKPIFCIIFFLYVIYIHILVHSTLHITLTFETVILYINTSSLTTFHTYVSLLRYTLAFEDVYQAESQTSSREWGVVCCSGVQCGAVRCIVHSVAYRLVRICRIWRICRICSIWRFSGIWMSTSGIPNIVSSVCCSVVQCCAVCCSAVYSIFSGILTFENFTKRNPNIVARVRCSVLQCDAVWCSVVQCGVQYI